MKFFSSAVVAFSLLSSSVFTSASVIPLDKRTPAPIEKRAVVGLDQAISIVAGLYESVQGITAQINTTSASITPESGILERTAASAEINALLLQITSLVGGATTDVGIPEKRALVKKQLGTPDDLAGLLGNLLIELSSTLNGVIAALGLGALLSGTLGGLVTALSGLLLALVPVVDNLLELVRRLLDGLLIALSIALVGLII